MTRVPVISLARSFLHESGVHKQNTPLSCFVSYIKQCPLYAPDNQKYEVSTLLLDRLSLARRKTTSLKLHSAFRRTGRPLQSVGKIPIWRYDVLDSEQLDACSARPTFPLAISLEYRVSPYRQPVQDSNFTKRANSRGSIRPCLCTPFVHSHSVFPIIDI